jgi:hypothetical protein
LPGLRASILKRIEALLIYGHTGFNESRANPPLADFDPVIARIMRADKGNLAGPLLFITAIASDVA